MKFEVKKDLNYNITFWIVVLILLGTFLYALLYDDSLSSKIIGCILTSSIIFVSLFFWFNTYYIISNECLCVKYGFIKKNIPVQSIQSISRSKTFIAGPAFATNKVVINYNNGLDQIFITPKDEDIFFKELFKLNNKIQRNG